MTLRIHTGLLRLMSSKLKCGAQRLQKAGIEDDTAYMWHRKVPPSPQRIFTVLSDTYK